MTKKLEIARVDVVGSFLRPDSLKRLGKILKLVKLLKLN